MYRALPALLLVLVVGPAGAEERKLPRVVLIGDSIRIGYAPLVASKLEGKAEVISHRPNGGDSTNVLKNLDEWVLKYDPDVIHLNCGLHDLRLLRKTKKYQVDVETYEKNLRQIVERIRKGSKATLIFATTTPIVDERHAKRGGGFDRHEADVRRYNAAALRVMREEKVLVNDLHAVVTRGGPEKLLGKDGTHYTPAGYAALADAVVEAIQPHLAARKGSSESK